ncbi:MAG: hypothetical protein ABS35_44265 [Kaistia sp. SCN 65-12]|jgi:hypothetical protein|nr:MAG: hypothetical protein ABS35_44265 [Kaistia sp. SCN 65-12]
MLKQIAAALFALSLAATPALAEAGAEVDDAVNTDLGDPAQYHAAFDAIHEAVAAEDAAGVAEWVSYPITVNVGGKALTIDDAAQFEAEYAAIITGDIKDAILAQSWETLFVNADGIMYGNGQVWLNGICKDDACAQFDVKIITIQSTSDITPKAN